MVAMCLSVSFGCACVCGRGWADGLRAEVFTVYQEKTKLVEP